MEPSETKLLAAIREQFERLQHGLAAVPIDLGSTGNPELLSMGETLNSFINSFEDARSFIAALAAGNLDVDPPTRNLFASPFKHLHAALLHLTWQTCRIAKGDYSQRVDFMGDFSTAFNSMVVSLSEHEEKLQDAYEELQAQSEELMAQSEELQAQNYELAQLYEESRVAGEELRTARDELEVRVEERTRELKESRDYLYRIMDTVPDPIFVKDREHRLQLVNTAMCRLAGRSREEMIDRTDYDFFPKKEVDACLEKDELLFKTGEEQVNEEEITTANGDKRVVLTKRARYSHAGGDEYIVGVISDVTGMKRAEAEVRELNADLERRVKDRTAQLATAYERLQAEAVERKRIFEALELTQFCVDKASIGIFRISGKGEITFANDLACRSLGYTREELGSMSLFDIDPTFDLKRFRKHRSLLRAEGFVTFESIHRRRDGSTFPVEITVNYLKYKGRVFSVSFAADITKRKRREEQLRENRLQMEELNRTLCRRVESEVAKNREKDVILIQQNRHAALGEALEHIIHQWKQPLNTIGVLVQLLQLEHTKKMLTDNYMRETVTKTMDLLDHMSETAEVFREYYKPETEKVVFALKEAVEKAFSFVEPAFRYQNIKVEITADPELKVFGYPKEFVQALLIIMTNARDAFREKRTETPRLAIAAFAEGVTPVITVTDNAGGIPEQAIDKVFDLYFTTKEATGGTGIGLYMARSIIENRMKGSLSVANIDYGARFRIEIGDPPGLT